MQKVIIIGGSPRVGKSTAAALLASKLIRPCLSTDDIGNALQSVLDINPMKGYAYPDYYAMRTKQQLIDDIVAYHKKVEPAIARLVETHSAWGDPLVMEGWALYPEFVRRIENEQVFSVWLIAAPGLLESRVRLNASFAGNEKVIENYLARSQWHNRTLLEQCRALKRNYIQVGENMTTEEIVGEILGML
ncbi:MAG: AAA family ATPase [Oscillospiraceae bacterium]|nr:AAA family ATPase [Oscillospiraceae bacterium]MCL1951628.1 AAA family ATPase [Oscillospiraceae bacterium]